MGNHNLPLVSRVIAVAGVAADVLLHRGKHVVEAHRVGADSHVVDQLGEVGSLARKAVCKRMGSCSGGHILKRVLMASGASVFLGESVAFVDVHQIGVLLQVVYDDRVFVVGTHGGHDVRIRRLPVGGIDGSVIACGCRSRDNLIFDVLSGKRTQSPSVLDVVHDLRAEDSAEDSHRGADHYDGDYDLDCFLPFHDQPSFLAADAAGGTITLDGHFSAHLPHCVHFA